MLYKKIAGAVLAMAMVFTMAPLAALAQTTTPTNQPTGDAVLVNQTYYSTLPEAVSNAKSGDTITLTKDINLYHTVVVDTQLTLDLNGKTITYAALPEAEEEDAGLIDVVSGGDLTIGGNGAFTYDKDGVYTTQSKGIGYTLRVAGTGRLVIENGFYEAGLTCVQAGDTSTVVIMNGTFRADYSYSNTYWLLNLIDNSSAQILVYGGSFESFDPAHSKTESPEKNFLAEGAVSELQGDSYVVKVQTVQTDTPQLDTTQPVTQVTAGLTDKQAAESIAEQATDLINQVLQGKAPQQISSQTLQNMQTALSQGHTIQVEWTVQNNITPQQEQIDLIAQALKDAGMQGNIAGYMDLSVVLKADNAVIGTIDQLNTPVQVTLALPQQLIKDGRSFYVVRVHQGQVQKIQAQLTQEGTITFSTDKFSTYALGYEDPQPQVQSPQTGDNTNYTPMIALGVAAVVLVIAVVLGKRHRNDKM